jgi:hypothetical protein
MKSIIKKIGYFLFLLLILTFAKNIGRLLVKGAWNSSTNLTYNDSLKIYLAKFPSIEDSINKHPKQLDELTFLDSIKCSSENNEITYYHTLVKNKRNDFDLNMFNSELKNQINSSLLKNHKMALQRRFKTKLNYVYFDRDGMFVSKITAEN